MGQTHSSNVTLHCVKSMCKTQECVPVDRCSTWFLPRVFLLCRRRNEVLLGADGVSDGKEFTFRQGGEEET